MFSDYFRSSAFKGAVFGAVTFCTLQTVNLLASMASPIATAVASVVGIGYGLYVAERLR